MITAEKLIKIIAEVLEVDESQLCLDTRIDDVNEWNSLNHLNILVAIDKECKGNAANIAMLSTVKTIGEIYILLKEIK